MKKVSLLLPLAAFVTVLLFFAGCGSYVTPYQPETETPESELEPGPGDLKAQIIDRARIELTWTDNTEGEIGYEISERKGYDDNFYPLFITDPDAESVILTDRGMPSWFEYRIRTVYGDGYSAYSSQSDVLRLNLAKSIDMSGYGLSEALDFSHDGELLAYMGRNLLIVNPLDGSTIKEILSEDGRNITAAFHPAEDILAVRYLRKVEFLSTSDFSEVCEPIALDDVGAGAIAYNPKGTRLALYTGSSLSSNLKIYNTEDHTQLHNFSDMEGVEPVPVKVGLSNEESHLVAYSYWDRNILGAAHQVIVQDYQTGEYLYSYGYDFCFLDNGQYLAISTSMGLKVFDCQDFHEVWSNDCWGGLLASAPDSDILFCSDTWDFDPEGKVITAFDIHTGEQIDQIWAESVPEEFDFIFTFGISPKSNFLTSVVMNQSNSIVRLLTWI